MAVDHNNPQSRDEEILIATIDGTEYNKNPQSRIEELLLELKEVIEEGGGGGGTTDYENLSNQPQVNGETLIGDKSGADLGLVDAEEGKGLSTNDYNDTEKAAVAAATSAISAMQDGSEIDSFGDVEVALLDKADISDLGTAAAKDSTNVVTSGSTDLVESGAVKDAIDAAVSAAYHHAGTKTVAQLTHDLLIASNEGNVYNITDSGTTTSDFIEGIGKTIDEGSNVGICKVGNTYMFDLLSGFVDTTNFVQKSVTAGLLKNDGTVNDEIEGDVATLKSGLTDLSEEVNGDATVYPYADVITIEDAIPANLADCKVKIEPVQDLHGYDKPWVGGAGKNKWSLSNSYTSTSSGQWVVADLPFALPTGTYTISFADASTSQNTEIVFKNADGQSLGNPTLVSNGARTRQTFAYSEDIAKVAICMYGEGRTISDIQIEVGSSATSYESYENICPISGHTEVDVQRTGKNLFNVSRYPFVDSYFIKATDGTAQPTSSAYKASSVYIHCSHLRGKTLVLNKRPGGNDTGIAFYESESVNSYISGVRNAGGEAGTPMTFTVPDNANYFKFTVPLSATDVQIEIETESTPYEPYSGKTYTIALGDTIYGGTVSDSGVMTVTHGIHTCDGTETVKQATTADVFKIEKDFNSFMNDFDTDESKVIPLVSHYKGVAFVPAVSMVNGTSTCYGGASGKTIAFKDSNFTSEADFTAYLLAQYTNGTPVTFCLPLATPTTIQLTPQQIQLLKGTNTLTASTGQISVTVNGVSGSIGAVQEQVNELAEDAPVLVASSSATGTYSDKLTELRSLYNSLPVNKIQRSYVMVGDVRYNITSIGQGSYNAVYMSTSTLCVISVLELTAPTPVLRRVIIDGTDGISIVDRSGTEDSTVFSLYA